MILTCYCLKHVISTNLTRLTKIYSLYSLTLQYHIPLSWKSYSLEELLILQIFRHRIFAIKPFQSARCRFKNRIYINDLGCLYCRSISPLLTSSLLLKSEVELQERSQTKMVKSWCGFLQPENNPVTVWCWCIMMPIVISPALLYYAMYSMQEI